MSIIKNNQAAKTTITRDMSDLDREVGNVYETVVVLCKRADRSPPRSRRSSAASWRSSPPAPRTWRRSENREQVEIDSTTSVSPEAFGACGIQGTPRGQGAHPAPGGR